MKKKFKALIVGGGKIVFGNSNLDPDSHYGAFIQSKKVDVKGIVDIKKSVILKIRNKSVSYTHLTLPTNREV